MSDVIVQSLGAIFVECLHIDAPSSETDLFESGTLDSLQLVELLVHIERHFGVQIAIESIDLEDLRTLGRIARLVAASTLATTEVRKEKKMACG